MVNGTFIVRLWLSLGVHIVLSAVVRILLRTITSHYIVIDCVSGFVTTPHFIWCFVPKHWFLLINSRLLVSFVLRKGNTVNIHVSRIVLRRRIFSSWKCGPCLLMASAVCHTRLSFIRWLRTISATLHFITVGRMMILVMISAVTKNNILASLRTKIMQ